MSSDNSQNNSSDINKLVDVMNSVNTNSEEAKANETSIKDADGKRIELEDD